MRPLRTFWIVPISGTTKRQRFEENLGAVNLGLSPENLGAISNLAEKAKVEGGRYPAAIEARAGRCGLLERKKND